MIKAQTIINLFRKRDMPRASGRDYQEHFQNDRGQRILEDLIHVFSVGKPSVVTDRNGRVDLEKTALNEAAKTVVQYIIERADYDAQPERKPQRRREAAPVPEGIPKAANHI